jgi:MoaA/NifB/PqqE/SkfB family radical SAM enzyme
MNKIIGIVDLTEIESLDVIYSSLVDLKKDVYEDNERIVIMHGSSVTVLSLIREILEAIDIPDFFVEYQQINKETKLDFNIGPSHCIYPWINLQIDNLGNISPCCRYQSSTKINIKQTTLKDAYHSDSFTELRNKLLSGQYPSECRSCWRNESAGIASMRQASKYKFREIYYKLNYQKTEYNNLQSLDLKLGNKCNLSCKICSRYASSKIADNDLAAEIITTEEFDQLTQDTKWASENMFWDQLLPLMPQIKYLDLYGGEPLMSKIHFNFLQKLIDSDLAKNIKIDYNTNGTIYSEKFFNYWSYFKEVKLSFSIDDIGKRFEEQRQGANWDQVCDNIRLYNSYKSGRFLTDVYPTINTQNVYWLPELINWIESQSFGGVSFNLLEHPYHYNISSLSIEEKKKVINKFKQSPPSDILNSIVTILEMNNHNPNYIQ